jgi:hypothetical protein
MSGTAQYQLPNSGTDAGSAYRTKLEGNALVAQQIVSAFQCYANNPVAMNVLVAPATLLINGAIVTQAIQTSVTITAPVTNPRIDRVVLDAVTGVISVVAGAENVSPTPPALPNGKLPIAQLALTVGMVAINNANITDERAYLVKFKQPTRQIFTSGTAQTYTTPAGVTRIVVSLIGGGGGGSGSGTGGGGGGTGGNTTFSTLTGSGGGGGAQASGGAGGAASGGDINIAGGRGTGFSNPSNTAGGAGGNGRFGGAGGGGGGSGGNTPGTAGATNSGGGGGGAASLTTAGTGGGGGAGGYVEKLILAPAASYTYTVGAAGTAGTNGTGGDTGGAGGSGLIIVDEFYN